MTKRTAVLAAIGMVLVSGLVGGGAAWAAQTFSDVPSTNPFVDEIEWAAANGIVNGYPDGTFKPGNNVTRQASVAFLGRYNDAIELQQQVMSPVTGTGGARATQCPTGKRAIGGGALSMAGGLNLNSSYPVNAIGQPADDPVEATGWRAIFRTDSGAVLAEPANITLWVLCAPPLTNAG